MPRPLLSTTPSTGGLPHIANHNRAANDRYRPTGCRSGTWAATSHLCGDASFSSVQHTTHNVGIPQVGSTTTSTECLRKVSLFLTVLRRPRTESFTANGSSDATELSCAETVPHTTLQPQSFIVSSLGAAHEPVAFALFRHHEPVAFAPYLHRMLASVSVFASEPATLSVPRSLSMFGGFGGAKRCRSCCACLSPRIVDDVPLLGECIYLSTSVSPQHLVTVKRSMLLNRSVVHLHCRHYRLLVHPSTTVTDFLTSPRKTGLATECSVQVWTLLTDAIYSSFRRTCRSTIRPHSFDGPDDGEGLVKERNLQRYR